MRIFLLLAVTALTSTLAQGAELKIAVMDLDRVLTNYVQGQQAVKDLKDKEVSFLKELQTLRLEGRKLLDDVETSHRLSLDNVLSAAQRETNKKTFEQKLTDFRAFEMRYEQTRQEREAEYQAQAARIQRRVLDEVKAATRRVGEREGVHLILNASQNPRLASDVMFARDVADVTEKILASLNQGPR
jgi:Skp family chaperone for outer membrane proteins